MAKGLNRKEWDKPLNHVRDVPGWVLRAIGWSEYVENLKKPYPRSSNKRKVAKNSSCAVTNSGVGLVNNTKET